MVSQTFHTVGKYSEGFLFLHPEEQVCIRTEDICHIGQLGQKRLQMKHVFPAADDLLIKILLEAFCHLIFHDNQLFLIFLKKDGIPLDQAV